MKHLNLPAVLITLLAPALSWANTGGCIYDGIKYDLFESISVVSTEYSRDIKKAGYSTDGYSLVLNCLPTIDAAKVAAGNFTIANLPTLPHAVWVPDVSHFSQRKPTINHLNSNTGTDRTGS